MSTREIAYSIIDRLSDEQITAFITLFGNALMLDEVPNDETLEALAEVEEMKKNPDKFKGYTDVDEMMKELLA